MSEPCSCICVGMNTVTLKRLADADPAAHGYECIIDVRSPSEFADDHLPGAVNMPVLDDAERALVGTIYKQQSPFAARKIGAALVAKNAARHIEGALAHLEKSWRPLVYCWRGGQRSSAFATILSHIGWRVGVVEGGYKTWRNLVNESLDAPVAHRLVLLDGNTGTAKTAVLSKLAASGAQVIDLEALARHRGSVFGHHALAQPSQRSFESSIARAFSSFDVSQPLFLEAESARIGVLHIPARVRAAMIAGETCLVARDAIRWWLVVEHCTEKLIAADVARAAPRVEITAPLASRAKYLVEAYSDIVADPSRLLATIERLRPLHSADIISSWRALAESSQHFDLALSLMRLHYDPSYAKSRARAREPGRRIRAESLDAQAIDAIAARVLQAADGLAAAGSGV